MAPIPSSFDNNNNQSPVVGNYTVPLVAMVSLFFLFGFVTSMNDILIPHMKALFDLQNWQAMLVQFCFFGAYFLMATPAGWILAQTGNQKGIILSLGIVAVGLLGFIPASMLISYPLFLLSLFVIGSGITILQVAANPYLSMLGNIDTAATRINLAGGLNSLATTTAPIVAAYFIFIDENASVIEKADATRIPYVGVALFVIVLAFVFSRINLPEVIEKTTERVRFVELFQFPTLLKGAGAIFAYVGAEVAIGSILIGYLSLPENGSFSEKEAATFVSYYWGSMMVGRLAGFVLLSQVRNDLMLRATTTLAIIALAVAFFTHGIISVGALVALGLFHSVMWSCIFPISIQGLGKYTHAGSGLLIMMIVGGAIIPVLQGFLIDNVGYKISFMTEFICYAWILWLAISAKKY
jgi:FHS family L-fucose permease-like MFS transporter